MFCINAYIRPNPLILGGLGPVAFVVAPLAYMRTTQALRLVDQHQVGEQHRGKAQTIRTLSLVILFGWLAVSVCAIGSVLLMNASV